MLLIFWYILLSLTLTTNVNSKKSKIKINDFITELMASEKFDELTDIIVNKAVKKIKNIGKNVTSQQKNNNDEELVVIRHYNDNAEVDEKKKEPPKLRQGNKKENKTVKEKKSIVSGKIDARTLLNDIPTEELLLSFKHLIQKHKKTEKLNDKKSKEYDASDIIDKRSENKKNTKIKNKEIANDIEKIMSTRDYGDSSYGGDSYNAEERKKEKRKEEMKEETKEEMEEEKKEDIDEEKKDTEEEREDDSDEYSEKEITDQAYNATDNSTVITNKSFDTFKPNDKINKNNNTMTSDRNIEENKSSKEIVEVEIGQSDEGVNKRSFVKETTTKSKKMFREENGQLFTFNSSPEYAEYHEKLAKEIKKAKTPSE